MDKSEITDRFHCKAVAQLRTPEAAERLASVLGGYRSMVDMLLGSLPEGRELYLAVTKLEESMLWATEAITRAE